MMQWLQTVPAGILQFPFYNLGLEILNYGALGSILGHELTHGFDVTGKLYDENGNYRPWWTNQTAVEYERRTRCFVEQYNRYRIPEIHAHVNGLLTLAENIADHGGMLESVGAYARFKARQKSDIQETLPGLEHLKPEQLIYLSTANLWCEHATLMGTKWSVNEPHAPNRARIWGTLSNSVHFANAWSCPPAMPMNPKEKCELW